MFINKYIQIGIIIIYRNNIYFNKIQRVNKKMSF
jgi:hypothetical protein